MSIEERLASGIADAVDKAVLGHGDLAVAATRGRRLRRRRRTLVVAGASATVAAVAATATLVAGGPQGAEPLEPDPAPPTGPAGWTQAEAGPLSARYGPLMIAVGDLVLVMGGHSDAPCPRGADCVLPDDELTDAATYDVATGRWAKISEPPVHLDQLTDAVVVDELVVVGTNSRWFAYDPQADDWQTIPEPGVDSTGPLAAADGLVYARGVDNRTREVLVLDVAARTWSALPTDPLTPSLTDTTVFATDAGVVLSGVNYEEAAPDEPTLTQADLWDGEMWTRLPRTGQIGPLYHWTGERLVGLEIGEADGGLVNGWDGSYPAGGSLDPATGEWARVPGLSSGYGSLSDDNWAVEAADGPLVATFGRVYDDRTQTWVDLGRPDSPVDSELAGVWANGRLVVVGGYDEDARGRGAAALSAETWIWSPGSPVTTDPPADVASASDGDPAIWTLPPATRPAPTTTSLTLDVARLGCNSGVTGIVLAPALDYREKEVVVTFQVETDRDGGRCPGNRPVAYDLVLEEPLGDRSLVDGACLPNGAAATTSWCQPDGVRFRPPTS